MYRPSLSLTAALWASSLVPANTTSAPKAFKSRYLPLGISEGTYIEAPTNWTQYQFDLSQYEGQTIRIAIHYMANDSFVLQTDSYTVDGTLGIEDSVINNFEYFYNISSKTLEMTSDETLRKIQIFNILGQKVFEENINSNVHTSNLTDLGTSIYIVNIEGTTGVKSFKLLIQ